MKMLNEIAESYKALGLIGGMFASLSAVLIYFVRYIIKSNEKKNNVISNHIQHSTEAMDRNTNLLGDVKNAIRDMRMTMERLMDKL